MNLLTPAQLLNGLPSPKAGKNAKQTKKNKNISLKELREQRAQQNSEVGKGVNSGKKEKIVQPQNVGGAKNKNNKKNKKKGQKAVEGAAGSEEGRDKNVKASKKNGAKKGKGGSARNGGKNSGGGKDSKANKSSKKGNHGGGKGGGKATKGNKPKGNKTTATPVVKSSAFAWSKFQESPDPSKLPMPSFVDKNSNENSNSVRNEYMNNGRMSAVSTTPTSADNISNLQQVPHQPYYPQQHQPYYPQQHHPYYPQQQQMHPIFQQQRMPYQQQQPDDQATFDLKNMLNIK